MPDMSALHAQVSARKFAARRSHPRRPRAGQQIRCRNLPCITPLIHTAPHLPPTPAACELLAICPTPHALPAQLHTPPAHCMCTAISQCVPPQVAAYFSQHPGTQGSRARQQTHRCAHILWCRFSQCRHVPFRCCGWNSIGSAHAPDCFFVFA